MKHRINDPGIGDGSSPIAKRIIGTDGTFNVEHINKKTNFSETYNFLLRITWMQFYGLSFLAYCILNIGFALIYMFIGVKQMADPSGHYSNDFFQAFFFSCQTFTTVGYGAMAPHGLASGVFSAFEAFVGLLFFAFVTGLLYGRFSKPKPSLRFSEHLIYRNYKEGKALMFRLVSNKKGVMIRPKVTMTLSLSLPNGSGEYTNNFYTLKPEREAITYLPATWTIVHEIEDDGPFHQFQDQELIQQHGEILVMVSYYDEAFNSEINQMYSYLMKDIKVNYKFIKAYNYNDKGKMTMDYSLFNTIEPHNS
ncbi:MAG: ion channel [Aquaticitalea sp.]